MVDGTHFRLGRGVARGRGLARARRRAVRPRRDGRRARRGVPRVVLPPTRSPTRTCSRCTRAPRRCARRCGVTIAGGDLAARPGADDRGDRRRLGRARRRTLVGRDGARPGDLVGVTGDAGRRGRRPGRARGPRRGPRDALVARATCGRGRGWPRAARSPRAGAHAMLDLSDGLASDALRLAEASGVRLELDARALPLAPGVRRGRGGARASTPPSSAATGGEDYELCACVPPSPRRRGGGRAAPGSARSRRARPGSTGAAPRRRDRWRGYEH